MKLKYREIKYFSHIFRNVFLYFFLFIAYLLIYSYQPSLSVFFRGLLIYAISYSAVYFFNDYADKEEDAKIRKSNLYLDFENKKFFWILVIMLVIFGSGLSYGVSLRALLLLALIYALNFFYSFKPLRFRNIVFLRESNIFVIYFVKWFLISEYLGFRFEQGIPWTAIIMGSAFASVNLTLYKRHVNINKFTEYFFEFIFFIFLIASLLLYKNLFILMLPPALITIYLSFKYKKEQIPIGKYQFIFFIYSIFLYMVILAKQSFFS